MSKNFQEVLKYEIFYGAATARMPEKAEILHVAAISGRVYVWALVDPTEPVKERNIGYFATGEPIPPGCEYVGTGITEGAFVWHVFQANEQSR